jgi:DNA-binding response OmpR family regulator
MHPTVLAVDDEPDVLDLIRFHLTRAGCEVVTAASGYTALEAIRARRPDLVLLDLMLPDIDGFAVCEILRRQAATAAIPIVIVSAWSTNDSRNFGLELDALDYVTKPFSPKVLVERVLGLFNPRAPGNDAILASGQAGGVPPSQVRPASRARCIRT